MIKTILILMLFASPVFSADLYRFELGATFAPPHNEPVVGDHVARYKADLDFGVRFLSRFTFDGNVRAWGLQDWRTIEMVGHGSEAWGNSDWSVKKIEYDYTAVLGANVYGPLQVIVEHHGRPYFLSSSTYWLFGVRLKIR